jgi:N-acetylmuramoyl-L-alanine amidase
MLWVDIPSALLESVFISNADECQWLVEGIPENGAVPQPGTRQDEIARAIYAGLDEWFSQEPPAKPGKGP